VFCNIFKEKTEKSHFTTENQSQSNNKKIDSKKQNKKSHHEDDEYIDLNECNFNEKKQKFNKTHSLEKAQIELSPKMNGRIYEEAFLQKSKKDQTFLSSSKATSHVNLLDEKGNEYLEENINLNDQPIFMHAKQLQDLVKQKLKNKQKK
jgi:hypothetical protein